MTKYNTYSFFALYANVDKFNSKEKEIPVIQRPEIDRWIISLLNSLVKEVEEYYEDYEPTKAARAIQHFVIENVERLSGLSKREALKAINRKNIVS